MSRKAREIIYGATEDDALRMAYLDYGNLKSMVESGIKSIDALRSKSAFRQAWELIVDKAITPVASFGANVLYRTGAGLEFVAGPGLTKIGDILTAKIISSKKE